MSEGFRDYVEQKTMTDHAQVDVAEQVIRDVHKELPEVWLGGRQRYVLVEAITKAITQAHAAGLREGSASQALAGNSSLMPLVTSLQAQLKGTKDAKDEIQDKLAIAEAGVNALNEEVADWRDRAKQLQATLAAREARILELEAYKRSRDDYSTNLTDAELRDPEYMQAYCSEFFKDFSAELQSRVKAESERDAAVQQLNELRGKLKDE